MDVLFYPANLSLSPSLSLSLSLSSLIYLLPPSSRTLPLRENSFKFAQSIRFEIVKHRWK